jgi:hypothetical protein
MYDTTATIRSPEPDPDNSLSRMSDSDREYDPPSTVPTSSMGPAGRMPDAQLFSCEPDCGAEVIGTMDIDNCTNRKCGDRGIKAFFFFGLGLLSISSLAPVCDSDERIEQLRSSQLFELFNAIKFDEHRIIGSWLSIPAGLSKLYLPHQ